MIDTYGAIYVAVHSKHMTVGRANLCRCKSKVYPLTEALLIDQLRRCLPFVSGHISGLPDLPHLLSSFNQMRLFHRLLHNTTLK